MSSEQNTVEEAKEGNHRFVRTNRTEMQFSIFLSIQFWFNIQIIERPVIVWKQWKHYQVLLKKYHILQHKNTSSIASKKKW